MNDFTRVDRGIRALDKKIPDWRESVDSAILDMYSHRDCVLGQVFGSYYVGTIALKLEDDPHGVIEYGFEVENPTKKEYKDLTDEWKLRLNGSNS